MERIKPVLSCSFAAEATPGGDSRADLHAFYHFFVMRMNFSDESVVSQFEFVAASLPRQMAA
jgi:hypothetical protein